MMQRLENDVSEFGLGGAKTLRETRDLETRLPSRRVSYHRFGDDNTLLISQYI